MTSAQNASGQEFEPLRAWEGCQLLKSLIGVALVSSVFHAISISASSARDIKRRTKFEIYSTTRTHEGNDATIRPYDRGM